MKKYHKPLSRIIKLFGEELMLETSNLPVGGTGTTHAPAVRFIEDDSENFMEE